jgi:hypothetical protein
VAITMRFVIFFANRQMWAVRRLPRREPSFALG